MSSWPIFVYNSYKCAGLWLKAGKILTLAYMIKKQDINAEIYWCGEWSMNIVSKY
jgi:hypothetical protein